MDLSFTTPKARLAISKADRVTIEGCGYRLHQETEVGFVFLKDDETQLAHQISHEEMLRLDNAHRVRVERGYFDPDFAVKRQLHASTAFNGLAGSIATRASKKEVYTQAAWNLRSEGRMSFTDTSIKANNFELVGRAMELAEDLNPSGKTKAKLPKSEDFSIPPSPRTLRRWLAAMNNYGRGGLVDRIDSRGNRSSRMGPEAIGLMMKEVRKYLCPEKPSIKQIHEQVQLSFDARNEQRKENGHRLS